MRIRTLRQEMTFWSALVVGSALVCAVLAMSIHIYLEEIESVDNQLRKEARSFFADLQSRPKEWDLPRWVETVFAEERDTRTIQVRDNHGAVIYQTSRLKNHPNVRLPGSNGEIVTERAGSKHRIRIGRFDEAGLTLYLGAELRDIDDMLVELIRAFAIAFPIVLLGVGIGGWRLARTALQPIETIRQTAELINARQLNQRLPDPGVDNELGRLVRVLNQMIERLDSGFQEVTRFTADASHELRTPLAIMSGEIESALAQPADHLDVHDLLANLLGDVRGLSKIVDNLMLLARSDAGKLELNLAEIDFSSAVEEVMMDAEILAEPGEIRIEREISSGISVVADALRVRQVLLNLVDNAVKYNQTGGAVRVALRQDQEGAQLTIANTGPGIAKEHAVKLFERFFRSDLAHGSAVRGSGLGLSICREIARAHGGELVLSRSDEEWTEFTLKLPRDPRKRSAAVLAPPE